MERKRVVSSNLSSVGYDLESKTLEVEFWDGAIWQYTPITEETKNSMLNAESIGSFFSANIKYNKDITSTKVK